MTGSLYGSVDTDVVEGVEKGAKKVRVQIDTSLDAANFASLLNTNGVRSLAERDATACGSGTSRRARWL